MTKERKSRSLIVLIALGLVLFRSTSQAVPTAAPVHGGHHTQHHGRHPSPGTAATAASVFTMLGSADANLAMDVSSLAGSVARTSSLKNINLRNASLTLTGGVYDLSKLQLDHSTLTLSGTGYFIFNISTSLALSAGKIVLTNGATESQVLFNYTGTNPLTVSSGTVAGGQNESVLHGILLAANTKVNLAPGLVVGEIISGQDVGTPAGSALPPVRGAAIVPDGASTLSLSIIALSGIALFGSFPWTSRGRGVRSA
jgi:hypothetical protein